MHATKCMDWHLSVLLSSTHVGSHHLNQHHRSAPRSFFVEMSIGRIGIIQSYQGKTQRQSKLIHYCNSIRLGDKPNRCGYSSTTSNVVRQLWENSFAHLQKKKKKRPGKIACHAYQCSSFKHRNREKKPAGKSTMQRLYIMISPKKQKCKWICSSLHLA